jgi:hypothetical protein
MPKPRPDLGRCRKQKTEGDDDHGQGAMPTIGIARYPKREACGPAAATR